MGMARAALYATAVWHHVLHNYLPMTVIIDIALSMAMAMGEPMAMDTPPRF